jgi:CheY-like chemotaxis protein
LSFTYGSANCVQIPESLLCRVSIQLGRVTGLNEQREYQLTIFLLEEDDETRVPLVSNLRRYGYPVITAIDEEDAMQRVEGGHVPADLVMVNLVGKSVDDALNVGRRVRTHAKYDGHTPLVVIAEKFGKDVEGTDVNVSGNDWITYPEDPDQLKNLLARLVS